MKRRRPSEQKRKLKAVKRLARKVRVPPTRAHGTKKNPRKRPRNLAQVMREEGWE